MIDFFFFFNDTATTEIYTLSLHDALPISRWPRLAEVRHSGSAFRAAGRGGYPAGRPEQRDRKSTRLNSSHSQISYAVFCLKKKNNINQALFSDNITTLLSTTLDRDTDIQA